MGYDGNAEELERLGTPGRRDATGRPTWPCILGAGSPLRGGLGRRRRRAELETLVQAARRWSEELEKLKERYEDRENEARENLPGSNTASP